MPRRSIPRRVEGVIRKVTKNGNSHTVAIPPRFLKYLEYRYGDITHLEVVLIRDSGVIVIKPYVPSELR